MHCSMHESDDLSMLDTTLSMLSVLELQPHVFAWYFPVLSVSLLCWSMIKSRTVPWMCS
jgi:hypothetical protein